MSSERVLLVLAMLCLAATVGLALVGPDPALVPPPWPLDAPPTPGR